MYHGDVVSRVERLASALLLLLLALSAPAVGRAETEEQSLARQRYARGEQLFSEGDYVAALEEFRAAYRTSPHPVVLTSEAACLERLGQHRAAAELYERYLADRPEAPNRAEIESRLDRIRAMPGEVRVTAQPAGARLTVDGAARSEPTPATLELAPGRHVLSFEAPGRRPATRELEVDYATSTSVDVALEAAPEEPAEEAASAAGAEAPAAPSGNTLPAVAATPRRSLLLPAWLVGGAAALCALTGVISGSLALAQEADFRRAVEAGRDREELVAMADAGVSEALVADVFYGAAVALGVTAVVLFAIEVLREEGEPDEVLLVAPSGSGALAGATFRF